MAEKHHPASSKRARVRTTRAMRHQSKLRVRKKRKAQKRVLGEPDGFVRGARVTKR